MKLKDFFALLGFKKPSVSYGYELEDFTLESEGKVSFAQWQHPKYGRTTFDQASVDALRRYISPGSTVIDIGAHSGDTSVLFALAAGPDGVVFAVEPNRYVLPILRKNASLNPDAARIEVLPFAATHAPCRMTFNYSDNGYCNGGDLGEETKWSHGHVYPLEVEGRNVIDEIVSAEPDRLDRTALVKTDTEGNDLSVLKSMKELIGRTRPHIMAEVYTRTPASERRAFLSWLDEMGYDAYLVDSWTDLTSVEVKVDDVMNWKHYDVFCVHRDRKI
ncbi:FkbM family methyltransferase [Pseudohoeflea suaedae]|uniref:FkbM family methyltransferase n=1 Tax=Pseudohoeflea suaedae TaxID=877384 RepID=A0A4V6PK09_9HYPH|nr:FkbM family methyltransferase [Pseudohoeflea suaedae]TDH36202.1 FkbM family methyltransferase [Pseudohoeflea suaedae]